LNIGAVETTVIVVHMSAKALGGSLPPAFLAGPKSILRRVATHTGIAAVQWRLAARAEPNPSEVGE